MALGVGALLAMVLVPFLYWKGTWFGRPLSDRELEQYLNEDARPRHIQHAIAQLAGRLERGDPSALRWYPRLCALGRHAVPEVRVNAAWLLGYDNRSDAFHQTLLEMLQDPEPLVRRNAALSLARFNDPAARLELKAMLRPFRMRSPREGVLRYRLQVRDMADHGTLLARLETGALEPFEIRSPLPGKLQLKVAVDGSRVQQDQEILELEPSRDHVWEALRALYLVGTPEDLPDVERFSPYADWPSRITEQAQLTAKRIRERKP